MQARVSASAHAACKREENGRRQAKWQGRS